MIIQPTRRKFIRNAAASLLAAPAFLPVTSKLAVGEPIGIWHFGATGDASQDATTALTNAITAVGNSKTDGDLLLRRGVYQTTAKITPVTNKAINIRGEDTQYDTGTTNVRGLGTWLFFNHLDIGIDFQPSNGIALRNFGTYRTQPAPGGGWAPNATDWDISINGDGLCDNLMFLNPRRGLRVLGRFDLNRIRGQAFENFIQVVNSLDTLRMTNCHMWNFWSDNANVIAYGQAHCIAYELDKADNPQIANCFAINATKGFYLQDLGSGSPQIPMFVNCGVDASFTGFEIGASAHETYAFFKNIYAFGAGSGGGGAYGGGSAFICKGTNTHAFIDGFEAQNFAGNILDVTPTTAGYMKIGGLKALNWDAGGAGFAAIDGNAAATIEMTDIPILTAGGGTVGPKIGVGGALQISGPRLGHAGSF